MGLPLMRGRLPGRLPLSQPARLATAAAQHPSFLTLVQGSSSRTGSGSLYSTGVNTCPICFPFMAPSSPPSWSLIQSNFVAMTSPCQPVCSHDHHHGLANAGRRKIQTVL